MPEVVVEAKNSSLATNANACVAYFPKRIKSFG